MVGGELNSVVLDQSLVTHSNFNFHSGLLLVVTSGSHESLFSLQERKQPGNQVLAVGGRFDNLVSTFSRLIKNPMTERAVGAEIRLTPLIKLALHNKEQPQKNVASVCVVSQGDMTMEKLKMAQELRQCKISVSWSDADSVPYEELCATGYKQRVQGEGYQVPRDIQEATVREEQEGRRVG